MRGVGISVFRRVLLALAGEHEAGVVVQDHSAAVVEGQENRRR